MKQHISESDFHDTFHRMGRGNQFSFEARQALFEYLTQLEEETGQEEELDVIGLCCEFSEYENLVACQKDSPECETLEQLREHGLVLEIPGTERLVVQQW